MNKPAELSNEELIRKEKTMRGLVYTFSGVLILLLALILFSLFEKHFRGTIITPVVFLPLLIVNLKNWRALKEEIKARGL